MSETIKCISIDIDGTLLKAGCYDNSKISENNIKAIKDFCSKEKNQIILATGRDVEETKEVFKYLCNQGLTTNDIPYLICMNGGIILKTTDLENPIFRQCFKSEVCNEIISYLEGKKYSFFVTNNQNELYHSNHIFSFLLYLIIFKKRYPERKLRMFSDSSNIQKIMIILRAPWVRKCKKKLEKASFAEKCYFSSGNKYYIEIIDKDVNKFFAIERVAKKMGLEVNDFAAIGNEQNDIMSLENVSFGVGVDLDAKPNHLKYDNSKIQFKVDNKKGEAVHDAIYEMKKRDLW
ncbi:putative phosphatase [Candidatus Mycoplasma haematohominis]|uniref:Putative phosphatase n=1 Tax=Candidatus Mycoplasma haematohominis TaxID=1494318 RepID=A0A478FPP1_9MOLU|nr:putative phosphatase [Candidatus Mycoplasma haemohominis]